MDYCIQQGWHFKNYLFYILHVNYESKCKVAVKRGENHSIDDETLFDKTGKLNTED